MRRVDAPHVHDSFRCPPHVPARLGCECEPLGETLCNPYYDAGYCPDNIERVTDAGIWYD